ncbi:MAG: single-stranded-DNA-specific exonuclease RecJ [Deltaproteobacteria bacterium]|nr:single-stranded-DNA-specific exonuclease RecJ [Deltaproteobacteria bacterium]
METKKQTKINSKLPLTQWRIFDQHRQEKNLLARELDLHPLLSRILVNRDITTIEEARKFLRPALGDLHNPFLMKDMKKGVRRLIKAMHQGQKIMVYGDYDADGITSVVLLVKFLRNIGQEVDYYIPGRVDEGYGLNQSAIDRMRDDGVNLIVTVDCGISENDHIAYAKTKGIDTIILDHHEIPDSLPPATATINPKQADCQFPFKHLSAVGIVFNFLIALRGELRKEGFWSSRPYPNLKEYLDIVALGTIGDISPLTDENRIFAKFGLDLMTETPRIGIQALKRVCGLDNQVIDSGKASFTLIPRINAAGRVASASDAVQLLLTEDMTEAREIAQKLDGFNQKRRSMEKDIFEEIIGMVNARSEADPKNSIVFASEKWHPGVIGIVASKLVDRFCRPAIVISLRDGIGKGSGRSISHFNIYRGLKKCEAFLLSYGGHRFAAGISIREEDVDDFGRTFDEIIRVEMDEAEFVSETLIDSQCDLSDVDHDFLQELDQLAPYGSRNPEPILCVRNASISDPTVVGNNHLRMRINKNGTTRNSIWFSKGHLIPNLTDQPLDIAFTPQISHWHGTANIQLKLVDVCMPGGAVAPQ